MTPEDYKVKEAAMRKAVDDLREHFDAVQILASFENDEPGENKGNTEMHVSGGGNWYARVGMAASFIERDREMDRCNARQQDDNDND